MELPVLKIDPKSITPRHYSQIVELLITTGHFQYVTLKNKPGLYYKNECGRNFVYPYLPYTKIVPDSLNNIAGYYSALSKSESKNVVIDLT